MVKLKKIKVEDALGYELLHDITGCSDNKMKITVFKKGHIITKEDIVTLKRNGKFNINTLLSDKDSAYHENDAAILMANKCASNNVELSDINEGKINFIAKYDGFTSIDSEELLKINMNNGISFGTLKSDIFVKKGTIIASFRIIDLFYDKEKYDRILNSIEKKVVDIKKIVSKKIALLSVGSEIYHNLIDDLSYDVLKKKLFKYQQSINYHEICDDNLEQLTIKIKEALKENDIVLVVGGMSVDADDISAQAIEDCADEIVSYGTPVIPGSMMLTSYYLDKVIMGLPANVIFSEKTVFDLVIPLILQDKRLTKTYIANLGYGGIELR